MDILQECVGFVNNLHSDFYKTHKKGEAIVSKIGDYYDLDYFPTDIGVIDSITYNSGEFVELCADFDAGKYDDETVFTLWTSSSFPLLLHKIVVMLSDREGVAIKNKGNLEFYTWLIMSSSLDEIEMAIHFEKVGLYADILKFAYICWLPVCEPYSFNSDTLKEFEYLIIRIALQVSDHIGKNGRSRMAEAKRTRRIAKIVKEGESKRLEIRKLYKEHLEKRPPTPIRNIAGIVASNEGVTPKHVRKIADEYRLYIPIIRSAIRGYLEKGTPIEDISKAVAVDLGTSSRKVSKVAEEYQLYPENK